MKSSKKWNKTTKNKRKLINDNGNQKIKWSLSKQSGSVIENEELMFPQNWSTFDFQDLKTLLMLTKEMSSVRSKYSKSHSSEIHFMKARARPGIELSTSTMSDPAAKKTSSSWSSISSTIFSPRFRILFSWHLFWVDWAETTWFQNSSNSFVELFFSKFCGISFWTRERNKKRYS